METTGGWVERGDGGGRVEGWRRWEGGSSMETAESGSRDGDGGRAGRGVETAEGGSRGGDSEGRVERGDGGRAGREVETAGGDNDDEATSGFLQLTSHTSTSAETRSASNTVMTIHFFYLFSLLHRIFKAKMGREQTCTS